MEEKYIAAIEIGSSKIRGALALVDTTGAINVHAVREESINDSVRYGQVRNIDETSKAVTEICRKLQNDKSINGRRIKSVYVGLSGLTVRAESAEATITFPTETPVTEDIIKELSERVATAPEGTAVYRIVPVGYSVDNDNTMKPVGRLAHQIRGRFRIIVGTPGLKSNISRAVEKTCGLKISDYIVTILAEADAVLSPDEKQLGCMLVDFGAETTTCAIFKGGVLVSLVTLPMGSRNITRDLLTLNFVEEKAEMLKRSIGIINPSDDTPTFHHPELNECPEIGTYILARANEIVANIMARIEFAGLTPADLPKGIILVGGGARLKGFSALLADRGIAVRTGSLPRKVRLLDSSVVADESIDVISLLLAAAVGSPEESLTEPERVEEKETTGVIDTEDDGGSRIGRMYDDEIKDDPDDDEEEEVDDDDDDLFEGEGSGTKKPKAPSTISSLISRIGARIRKMANDDEMDDDFEDEK